MKELVDIVKSSFEPNSPIIITKSSIGIDLEKTERGKEILKNSYERIHNLIIENRKKE